MFTRCIHAGCPLQCRACLPSHQSERHHLNMMHHRNAQGLNIKLQTLEHFQIIRLPTCPNLSSVQLYAETPRASKTHPFRALFQRLVCSVQEPTYRYSPNPGPASSARHLRNSIFPATFVEPKCAPPPRAAVQFSKKARALLACHETRQWRCDKAVVWPQEFMRTFSQQ